MKRPLGITALVLLVSLLRLVPASAGLWAWLEEWSGPGPFRSKPGQTWLLTYCVQDSSLKASPISNRDLFHTQAAERAVLLNNARVVDSFLKGYRHILTNPTLWDLGIEKAGIDPERFAGTKGGSLTTEELNQINAAMKPFYGGAGLPIGPGHRDKRLICGFADFAYYSADAGGGFPQLTAKAIDVGFSARLHDGIDLGGGGGRMIFRGDEVKKGYWTLTPVRLIVRPLLLALPEERRRGWMGFLNIYWKETYVAGPITAAHFAAPSKDWAVQGELVRSFGFNIDIAALLPSNWHGPRTN